MQNLRRLRWSMKFERARIVKDGTARVIAKIVKVLHDCGVKAPDTKAKGKE